MNSAEIISFVIEQAASQPVPRRIDLYRGLAALCMDRADKETLLQLAEDLEHIEQRSRQFLFTFASKSTRSTPPTS